jgi:hypothetical protein
VNDSEGLGMVKNFGFNATRSKNPKKNIYKIENEPKSRILDSWLESADRPTGPRNFLIFFAQEPSVTWKFDYSSQKNTTSIFAINPKS